MGTLIAELLPEPDIQMRHVRGINATPERVFAALSTTDFGQSGLVSLLLAIRSLPAFLLHPIDTLEHLKKRRPAALTLAGMTRNRFGLVAERPNQEIVLGVTGRFWQASAKLRPANREQFRAGPPPGEVLVAWNFLVETAPDRHCRLSTETRILAADVDTRLTFKRYWLVVHPGSALIRRSMLAAIDAEATRAG
jgi:hypothetical protein